MESMSNMGFTETGVLEDQTIPCNSPTVSASSINLNSSIPDVQGLEKTSPGNTQILSVTEVVPETKYLNEMPLDSEDPTLEAFENDSENVVASQEDQVPTKALSPTIFESAVKVVKNLFSPAKAHGIFSRGISQQDNKQLDAKKILNGEIKFVNGNTSSRIEQPPVVERKGSSLSFSNLESNLYLNEGEAFSLAAKHVSNSVDAHNNTNDSYTSTVSRMEESFQSTVTHFDDCVQNEVENSHNSAAKVENVSLFNNSMNDTIDANDHSPNNTLKKDFNSSVIENGELNVTFEGDEMNKFFIPKIENEEICSTDAKSLHENSTPCDPNVQESGVSKNAETSLETAKEALELVTETVTCRETEENQSFQEQILTEITTSSTPKKQQSIENANPVNSSFLNFFAQTLYYIEPRRVENNVEDSNCCSLQDGDAKNEESLGRFPTVAHSSDIACSDSSTCDNFLLEKSNSPTLCNSLEKNFSTSTIVISKNDFDIINSGKEKDTLVPKHQLSLTDQDSLINTDVKEGNIGKFTATGQKHSDGICVDNKEGIGLYPNKTQLVLKNVHETDTGENCNNPTHFNMTEFVKNYSLESEPLDGMDIEKAPISEKQTIETFNQNLKSLNLIEGDFVSENELELKSEVCPINEVEIPLASQKSYTVLHNVNPDLNLPIVFNNTCDVQADKLNEVILGNGAFSDLDVLCNKNIPSDEINIPDNQIDASTSDFVEVNIDRISTDTTRNTNSDNTDLKTCNLEIPNGAINTGDMLEKSLSLSSKESHITAFVESEKETYKYLEDKESSSPIDLPGGSLDVLSNVSKKAPKSQSAIVKLDNSISTSGNPPGADVLFLAAKKEDKTNKKSHSEFEFSPVGGHISSDKTAKETLGNNIISSFISGDGSSLSSGNFDVPMEKNDFTVNSYVKDLCGKEEVVKSLTLNLESKSLETMESEVENGLETPTLQIELENVISDLERLKMNDSATEKPNTCYPNSDNPFYIGSKLNYTLDLDDEGDLGEKNVKALNSVNELSQFIKEQFTVTDIEKICSVVDDMTELNLSKNIALASENFDKSFHGKILNESDNNVMKVNNFVIKDENDLNFLDSIKGKPSSRDYSRESLYIKFDPLIQSAKHSAKLLDISEGDKENVIASPINRNNNSLDSLIPITPLKPSININSASPLTPTSQNESKLSTEKLNKLRELQNEISRLREYYLQREESHKEKMNNYENVIAELTEKAGVLEDKLKESEEMEKLLLKKLNTQNESMSRLRSTIEECMTYISKLTDELQKSRMENQKEISVLKEERDYYMNHLQMTEQAFSDVFKKYEKCKEAVKTYKKNEEIYNVNIDNMKDRIEEYSEKIRSMQESAAKEVSKLKEKMNDLKLNQTQEISKYKAQLRITELKVQTMQEALEQKIKENQELAGICDELIESKECDR